ncbi:MAG TPA: nucleoside hydrolase [Pseudonocardia sp.]|nr:nucleoside hydrolase [Pseudonocardia sp.]
MSEALAAPGHRPDELRGTPLIIDTDIGGDADDALAVAAAARRVPELTLVITADEVGGERARFARYLLDLLERREVATVAGSSLGGSRYFCVADLVPDAVPTQPDDVVGAVRRVCAAADGPVRWVGLGPLTNLARVLAEAPDLGSRLRVTQMGGALRYHDPDSAEHNIGLDVSGARAVLRAVSDGVLGTPEFVSADVTFTPRIAVTSASPLYARLRAPEAPTWAGVLADHLDRWFARFYPDTMQHDPLALAAALGLPFVESGRLPLEIDAIGRTSEAPDGTGTPVWWSRSAAYDPFMTWLAASLVD